MRIAVLGYSGAGKSTLARALGEKYGCPVLHLDQVQFTAGWRERDRAEALALVREFQTRPDWVIDGNYTKFDQARRLALAERIVLLEFPRRICLPRAVKRWLQYRGRTRESMAEGCVEKLDWAFLRWILWEGRTRAVRDRYRAIRAAYPDKTVVLKTPAQVRAFLSA